VLSVVYVPEEKASLFWVVNISVAQNVSIKQGFVNSAKTKNHGSNQLAAYKIRADLPYSKHRY